MYKTIKIALLLFCSAISIVTLNNDISLKNKSLDSHIAKNYLQATFGDKPIEQAQPSSMKKSNLFKIPRFEKKTLTERKKQEIAFNIAIANEQSLPTDVTIDKTFIDKMELVSGGQNSKEHLVNKIFTHAHTAMGKSWCALNLGKPTTNISHIKRRQKAIQLLLDNEQLLQELDQSLAELKKVEHQLLHFWHHQALINPELLKIVYFNSWLDKLNTNTVALETSNKLINLVSILYGTTFMPIMITFQTKKYYENFNMPLTIWQASKIVRNNFFNLFKSNNVPLSQKLIISIPILFQGFMTYASASLLKNKIDFGKNLQEELIDVASYLHNVKNIKFSIKNNKELLRTIPALKQIMLLDNNKHHSSQFIKLISMLETNTFKGKPSAFSITGRVLAAHKLMTIVKDEFTATLNAIAELDAYVGLAKLLKNQQSSAPYSFVDFKKDNKPSIQAINFWNPFVNPETVVTNTIGLGYNNAQNVVLTGPNTGGKSTTIKALLINILLAQTFGVAAAEQFAMTPFKKLNCYLNITDDIAAGVSLFQAEVLRAKELINTLRTLPADDFCFTIMDEVFSGTSPQEGAHAAYKFSEQLGSFDNSINIIATHYPELIDLEQNTQGNYKNYHVEIIRNEDGSLKRTFKLLPEPSRMNIALDLLKEQNIL